MQKEILCKDTEVRMSLKGRKTDTKTMQAGNRNQQEEERQTKLVGKGPNDIQESVEGHAKD